MAKIICSGKEIEVKDGDSIVKACEEFGVSFGCYEGDCGVCKIEVVSGMENLNPLTDKEKDASINGNFRLACMCKIKSGTVEIRF